MLGNDLIRLCYYHNEIVEEFFKTILSKVENIFLNVAHIEVALEKLISNLCQEDQEKTCKKGENDDHTTNRSKGKMRERRGGNFQ